MEKASFKISNKKKRNSNEQQVVFEGDLSIFNAEKIYKKIKRMSITAENVDLNLQNVDTMDLSTIQLLISLKKTLEKKSSKVTLSGDIPDDKLDLLSNTGFQYLITN